MAITVTLHSGHVFTANEAVTIDKLNQMLSLGYGSVDAGTVDTDQITDKAVTVGKMADLTAAYMYVGNASNRPVAVALSGDVSMTATGAATVNNKLADTTQWHADDTKFPEKTNSVDDDIALIEDSAASWAKKKMKLSTIRAGILPSRYKFNLVVKNNSGTPNTKVDLSADELCVTGTAGTLLLSSLSTTIDATTTGANALDTGVIATGMYYVWAIYNPTSATSAGLISLSNTNPTMPSGYTHKRLCGEIYYDTTAFVGMNRQDDTVGFTTPKAVYTATTLSDTPTVQNLPASIPSGCSMLHLELSSNDTANKNVQIITPSSAVTHQVTSSLDTSAYGSGMNSGLTGGYGSQLVWMHHLGATTIYARNNEGASTSEANQNCHVWGYVLPR